MIGRAIVPNGSARRASGGVLGFFGCCSRWLLCTQAPIDWGQSIYHASSLVEPLSPMAPPDAQAAASSGFSAVALAGYGALRLRSIGDNRSTMARKPGGGGFFSYKSHRSRMLESGAKKTIIKTVDSSLEIRRGSLESKEIQSVEISGGKP